MHWQCLSGSANENMTPLQWFFECNMQKSCTPQWLKAEWCTAFLNGAFAVHHEETKGTFMSPSSFTNNTQLHSLFAYQ